MNDDKVPTRLLVIDDNQDFLKQLQDQELSKYFDAACVALAGPEFEGEQGVERVVSIAAQVQPEDLLLDVIARQREDSAKIDLIVGTSFQLRDLCAEAKEQRRFMDPKTKLDLGVSGITIGDGVDFTYDSDCPAGYAFMMRRGGIKLIEADPLGFMDMDGNVLKYVSGKDAYEAILFHYFNLCAFTCFDQARIEDIIENRVGDA